MTTALMLADQSDLAMYDLVVSPDAMIEIRDADACALCRTRPVAPDAPEPETYSALTISDDSPQGRWGPDVPRTWREFRSREVIDSRLSAVMPIPTYLLDLIEPNLDPALRDFIASAFTFAICGKCTFSEWDAQSVASTLRSTYIDLHFDGNAMAAAAQPSWDLVERFLEIVSEAAARFAREA